MYEYKGKSVFGGIAIGRIKVYSKEQQQVKRMHIDDCESEKQRYINAVDKAVAHRRTAGKIHGSL